MPLCKLRFRELLLPWIDVRTSLDINSRVIVAYHVFLSVVVVLFVELLLCARFGTSCSAYSGTRNARREVGELVYIRKRRVLAAFIPASTSRVIPNGNLKITKYICSHVNVSMSIATTENGKSSLLHAEL